MPNRLVWADNAKAIAIWLMVFCHANLNSHFLMTFIYIFHMPVFFLISGFFDHGEGLSWTIVKKNFNNLIRPYFIYSLFGFLICWISPYLHPELFQCYHNMWDVYKAAFVGMFLMDDHISSWSFMPLGVLWFLVALFFCKLFWLFFISAYKLRPYFVIMPLLLCLFIWQTNPSVFSLDSAVMAIPFYAGGFLMKKYRILDLLFSNKCYLFFTFVALTLYLIFEGVANGKVDMDGCNYGNNLLSFYVNGFLGALACILLAQIIDDRTGLMAIVGRSTMMVLAIHPLIIYICKVVAVLIFHLDLMNFPMYGSFIIACLACLTVVLIRKNLKYHWLDKI